MLQTTLVVSAKMSLHDQGKSEMDSPMNWTLLVGDSIPCLSQVARDSLPRPLQLVVGLVALSTTGSGTGESCESVAHRDRPWAGLQSLG